MNPQQPFQPQPPTNQPPSENLLPPIDASLYPRDPAPIQPDTGPYAPPQQQPSPLAGFPVDTLPQPAAAAPDYSIDYLNSIAPNQQKMVSKFAVFGLIGGILIAAIVAVLLLSAPKGASSAELVPPIAARIATLQTVTTAQQKHLSENQISETNAALSSALTSMSTNIQAIIKTQKLPKSQAKGAAAKEKVYSDTLSKTFDDAYQRGTLDRTYTSQMIYELTVLESQIESLSKRSKNKDIQAFTTDGITNIDTVLKSYQSFDASKQ